jgi:hypothetical protein
MSVNKQDNPFALLCAALSDLRREEFHAGARARMDNLFRQA